jgi:hypothetical protein
MIKRLALIVMVRVGSMTHKANPNTEITTRSREKWLKNTARTLQEC